MTPDDRPGGRMAVLALIKRQGPISADAAAAALKLTPMAVRQHLQVLERDGLVRHAPKAQPRGRPVQLWRTAPGADALFADSHSALAADLIAQMKAVFGEAGLDRILERRTAEQAVAYGAALADAATLGERLTRLAEIRSTEGYMAEARPEVDGAWLLVEHHCPVCAAARLCTGLCREELSLFQRVLGEDARIERITHTLTGAGRCAYRVSEERTV
jgi:predicted ArsR family transcriptional regulator